MEMKLMTAAEQMPGPALDFQMIEQHMKVTVNQTRKNKKVLHRT